MLRTQVAITCGLLFVVSLTGCVYSRKHIDPGIADIEHGTPNPVIDGTGYSGEDPFVGSACR